MAAITHEDELTICRREETAMTVLPRVAAELDAWTERDGLLGAQVFVCNDHDVVADLAYGRSDPDRPATPGDVSRLYCAVKPVVACCLARAVERGWAGFDDEVGAWVPRWRGAGRDGVTLRQLLTHTSGMPQVLRCFTYGVDYDAYVREACTQPLAPTDPQAGPAYVSWTWHVLASAIERIYGGRIEDIVAAEIAEPLGVATLRLTLPESAVVASCFRSTGRSYGPVPAPRHDVLVRRPNPSDGGFASARDLALFYAELLRCRAGAGSVLSVDMLRQLTTPCSEVELEPGGGARPYGLGFFVGLQDEGLGGDWSPRSFGHSGAIGRHRVIFGFADPDRGIAAAIRLFSVDARSNWRIYRIGRALSADLGRPR